MYTNEQMKLLGAGYRMLSDIVRPEGIRQTELFYADMYPYRSFSQMVSLVIKLNKMTPKVNKMIADILSEFDIEDICTEEKPTSLEQRGFWQFGYANASNWKEEKDSKLKQKRLEQKLTQKELADKIGVNQKDISRWENKLVKPSVDKIKLLAEALSCTTDDII